MNGFSLTRGFSLARYYLVTRVMPKPARLPTVILGCTTAGIISEVYAALTWQQAQPLHSPAQAAAAAQLLIEPPSAIRILETNQAVALRMINLAEAHGLRARRVHDARHAAAALVGDVLQVYTYDTDDWQVFEADDLIITGPDSTLRRLGRS